MLFVEKLNNALASAWQARGGITCKARPIEDNMYLVNFFPAIREVYGGPDDGKTMFPSFGFNVGKFTLAFDSPPKVCFKTHNDNIILVFTGEVLKVKVKVVVWATPPAGQDAVERVYAVGPKKGKVELIHHE